MTSTCLATVILKVLSHFIGDCWASNQIPLPRRTVAPPNRMMTSWENKVSHGTISPQLARLVPSLSPPSSILTPPTARYLQRAVILGVNAGTPLSIRRPSPIHPLLVRFVRPSHFHSTFPEPIRPVSFACSVSVAGLVASSIPSIGEPHRIPITSASRLALRTIVIAAVGSGPNASSTHGSLTLSLGRTTHQYLESGPDLVTLTSLADPLNQILLNKK